MGHMHQKWLPVAVGVETKGTLTGLLAPLQLSDRKHREELEESAWGFHWELESWREWYLGPTSER